MHRTDAPGATVDNKFTDGDPVGGVASTIVDAAWLNDVQENIIAVLIAAGVAPTKGRAADLLDSIRKVALGRVLNIRVITATTVYTPTPGTTSVYGKIISGGGAGGGAPSTATGNTAAGLGGSAGGISEFYFPVSTISGQTITIGAGGTGVANSAGNNGGTSSIGGVISVPGGQGGSAGSNAPPPWTLGESGNSAAPAGGNIANSPGPSGGSSSSNSTGSILSGRGGSCPGFGAGGNARGNIRGNGTAGTGYGSGGSGAIEQSAGAGGFAGGAGTPGVCIIWELA